MDFHGTMRLTRSTHTASGLLAHSGLCSLCKAPPTGRYCR